MSSKVGFPTGRDSAIFQDKETEVQFIVTGQRDTVTSSKSCHEMERAGIASQNLATGWDRPGQPVKIRGRTRDGTRDRRRDGMRDRTREGTQDGNWEGTRDGTGQDRRNAISCCLSFFCFRTSFFCFLFSLENYFVLGHPGTEGQAQNLAMGRDGPG